MYPSNDEPFGSLFIDTVKLLIRYLEMGSRRLASLDPLLFILLSDRLAMTFCAVQSAFYGI